MKVGIRLSGKVLRVDPKEPKKVYADRDGVGAHEEVELTKHDDGYFDLRFIEANVQFTLTPDGGMETRSAGTFGEWEQFRAASMPTDEIHVAYRYTDRLILPVFTIDEVQ